MFKELSPWLQSSTSNWSSIYQYGQKKTIESGEIIYTVGQIAKKVYIIIEGRVRLFHTSHDGKEKALIIMCDGTILGDSVIDGKHFESSITASQTILFEFDRTIFMDLLKKNNDLLEQLLKIIDCKSQTLALTNLLISCYDSETRIRYALFHIANQFGTSYNEDYKRIYIQFTQQELADLVGTSRVTVANLVNVLIQQGLIEKDGRFYIIPSIKRLLPEE